MNKLVFNNQLVNDVNLASARRDKQIAKILRTYNEEELFDQILHLCVCRGYAIERIKNMIDNTLVD